MRVQNQVRQKIIKILKNLNIKNLKIIFELFNLSKKKIRKKDLAKQLPLQLQQKKYSVIVKKLNV